MQRSPDDRSPARRRWCWGAFLIALAAGCASSRRPADEVPLDALRSMPKLRLPPAPADAGAVEQGPEAPAVRALSWGVFGEGERIAELQGIASGPLSMLAWVTYVDPVLAVPSPRPGAARTPPRSATVFVRPFDAEGDPIGVGKVVSTKAVGLGGVSLATSTSHQAVTIAWTGQEAGKAQVFLTQVDRTGEKTAQRMLTRGSNDCSDVAITASGEGFLVAWVEQPGTNGEIHAARVGRDLARIGEAHKVADAGGDASQVRFVAQSDDAMLVWSEVRAGRDKSGIFGVRLAAATLAPRADVTRFFPVPHAQSLRLARWRDGWAVGWLENAGAIAPGAHHAAVAAIGATREPSRFEAPAALTSFALECDVTCRLIAAGARGDGVDVFAWQHDLSTSVGSTPRAIGAVMGTSGEDMSPVLLGNWLFFAEDDLHGKGRIAKSRLFWP